MGREAGPGKIVASRRVESSASGDGSHGTIQPAAVLGEVLIALLNYLSETFCIFSALPVVFYGRFAWFLSAEKNYNIVKIRPPKINGIFKEPTAT